MMLAVCRLVVLVALLALVPAARATTFVVMDEETLVKSSEVVLLGTVLDVESVVTSADGSIHTNIYVEPTDLIKGDVGTGTVVLREPGGAVGDRREWTF